MTVIGLQSARDARGTRRAKPRYINVFPPAPIPVNRPDRKFRLDPTRSLAYAELWQPFTLWSP